MYSVFVYIQVRHVLLRSVHEIAVSRAKKNPRAEPRDVMHDLLLFIVRT